MQQCQKIYILSCYKNLESDLLVYSSSGEWLGASGRTLALPASVLWGHPEAVADPWLVSRPPSWTLIGRVGPRADWCAYQCRIKQQWPVTSDWLQSSRHQHEKRQHGKYCTNATKVTKNLRWVKAWLLSIIFPFFKICIPILRVISATKANKVHLFVY